MTTPTQRLQSIEELITPKQAVLRYLVELVACNTLEAYLEWAFDDAHIKKMKETHVILEKQAVAGIPKTDYRALKRARQAARREYNGLLQLAFGPMHYVEENRYRWLYEISTMPTVLKHLFEDDEPFTLARGLSIKILDVWADLDGFIRMVEHLQESVFEGIPALLPIQQQFLEERRTILKGCINLLNDYLDCKRYELPREAEIWKALSLSEEALQAAAKASQDNQFKRLKHEVKVYLLKDEDREREGLLLERQGLKERMGFA